MTVGCHAHPTFMASLISGFLAAIVLVVVLVLVLVGTVRSRSSVPSLESTFPGRGVARTLEVLVFWLIASIVLP